jgi:DNA-binding NarL/FixJ family response regulator
VAQHRRIFLIVRQRSLVGTVLKALDPSIHQVIGYCDEAQPPAIMSNAQMCDIWLVDLPMLRTLMLHNMAEAALMRASGAIVLIARSREMSRIRDLGHMIDGLLLVDTGLGLFADSLALAKTEHSLVPPGLLADARSAPSRGGLIDQLAEDERRVLELLALGKTNREIGETIGVSDAVAKLVVRRLLAKLGYQNRTEAAVAAVLHQGKVRQGDDAAEAGELDVAARAMAMAMEPESVAETVAS